MTRDSEINLRDSNLSNSSSLLSDCLECMAEYFWIAWNWISETCVGAWNWTATNLCSCCKSEPSRIEAPRKAAQRPRDAQSSKAAKTNNQASPSQQPHVCVCPHTPPGDKGQKSTDVSQPKPSPPPPPISQPPSVSLQQTPTPTFTPTPTSASTTTPAPAPTQPTPSPKLQQQPSQTNIVANTQARATSSQQSQATLDNPLTMTVRSTLPGLAPTSAPKHIPDINVDVSDPPKIEFIETGSIFGDRKRPTVDRSMFQLENGRFRSPGLSKTIVGPGGRTIRVSFVSGFPAVKSAESHRSLGYHSKSSRKSIDSSQNIEPMGSRKGKLFAVKSTTRSYKSISSYDSAKETDSAENQANPST